MFQRYVFKLTIYHIESMFPIFSYRTNFTREKVLILLADWTLSVTINLDPNLETW